ncbi:hypothetical protein L2E82_41744 [Cichorium intybus]|uniref:Uncharacterized protein n=1 Tax=Cichorium intybus TaxID=13427 RepID=A0ACB8ZKE0_CICIN|nr:hypothetical protein L2E82_41744 [Cichorium intybus]
MSALSTSSALLPKNQPNQLSSGSSLKKHHHGFTKLSFGTSKRTFSIQAGYRTKRRKISVSESTQEVTILLNYLSSTKWGEKTDNHNRPGVVFGKDLRFANDEIAPLHDRDLKNLKNFTWFLI